MTCWLHPYLTPVSLINGLVYHSALLPSRWTNDRAGDLARGGEQAMEGRIDLVMPGAMRAGHNVEIVEIAARRGRDHVIALGNENEIPIMDRDGFIQSLVGVDALKGKAIGWLKVMVIGLLQ